MSTDASETETWAGIGDVEVSNLGRIRKGERYLSGSVSASGYITVAVEGKTKLVHRLVVEAFDGPPPTEQHTDVRHLDGDKTNNRLSNLRYGTRSENMRDVVRHRGRKQIGTTQEKTRSWFQGRLRETRVLDLVFRLEAAGHVSQVEAALLLDVPAHTVSNILRGRSLSALPLPKHDGQPRRTPAEVSAIGAAIREGKTRVEINETLTVPLTAQSFYYYKQRYGEKQ